MTKLLHRAVALAISFVLLTSVATAATATRQQKMLGTLVGTWHCIARTSDHKTNIERDTYAMWGSWLKDSVVHPAQNGKPARNDVGYIRYDPKQSRWVSSFVDSQGNSRVLYSDSQALVGTVWQSADSDDTGSTTVKSLTARKLVLDSKDKDSKGKVRTQQQVCAKVIGP